MLAIRDPFGLGDLVRAAFLIRLLVLARCLVRVDRERTRLRRIALCLGELDAALSVATLRAERADARIPALTAHIPAAPPHLVARDLVHPAIAHAVGNALELAGRSLLVTGSNMSGKSTFLRTVAVNAILAQSIHTTFGTWDASVFRVHAAMRIADDTEAGTSTYAAEVAAIGGRVAAVTRADEPPALFVIDEPFRGTNPTARVPIVVAVLDYLAGRDVVLAATHDLEVAAQVDARFLRGYFIEGDDAGFDHKLRPGVAPSVNAVAVLARAGFPDAILRDVVRRARPA